MQLSEDQKDKAIAGTTRVRSSACQNCNTASMKLELEDQKVWCGGDSSDVLRVDQSAGIINGYRLRDPDLHSGRSNVGDVSPELQLWCSWLHGVVSSRQLSCAGGPAVLIQCHDIRCRWSNAAGWCCQPCWRLGYRTTLPLQVPRSGSCG